MNVFLKVVEDKNPNQIWGLTREDGMLVSASNYLENIPRMINAEFEDAETQLVNVVYNNQPMNYTITAVVLEDEIYTDHTFTLSAVPFYN